MVYKPKQPADLLPVIINNCIIHGAKLRADIDKSKHNKIMKQRAEDNRRQFSLFYDGALDRASIKQDSEAYALGMSQSYVAKCTNPDSDTNLSVADVKDSLIREQIVVRLAEDIGYTAVPGKHKLNGTTKNEKAAVLRAMAKMTEVCEEKCEIEQWKVIAEQAATAIIELSK